MAAQSEVIKAIVLEAGPCLMHGLHNGRAIRGNQGHCAGGWSMFDAWTKNGRTDQADPGRHGRHREGQPLPGIRRGSMPAGVPFCAVPAGMLFCAVCRSLCYKSMRASIHSPDRLDHESVQQMPTTLSLNGRDHLGIAGPMHRPRQNTSAHETPANGASFSQSTGDAPI